MKLFKSILVLAFIVSSSSTSYAQFGELFKKVKNTVNNVINDKPSNTESSSTKNYRGKIYFSSTPFNNATDISKSKTLFTAGDEIYGMVVLDTNFGELFEDNSKPFNVNFYTSMVNIIGDKNGAYTSNVINMHQKNNNQNYILFDVSPAPDKAISYVENEFMRTGILLATVDGNEMHGDKPKLGNIRTYEMEFLIGYEKFAKSTIEIDYRKATKQSMKAWKERESKAFTKSKSNSEKANNAEATEITKGLGLPKSYSFPSANPYSDPKYSKPKIIAMLKNDPAVAEVLSLKFIKTTASSDFDLRKTVLGDPDYKFGNRIFQFIFKDKNGKCLISCGRLRLNHEGGGRYGEAQVVWQLAQIDKNEGFVEDGTLVGHLVDCSKAK